MSYIAPAGTRLGSADLVAGIGAGVIAPGGARAELEKILAARAGREYCTAVTSGRAAMTLVLRAMRRAAGDAARDQVLIPGYTCYSVPAAAERAGLVPRLVDIDPATLGVDMDALRALDTRRVLGIVSANLYGAPNNLADIEAFARERGIFMLDDAAQALGATLGGRAAGGFGDAGLYSFDKGKIITTIQGGAVVARSGALAEALESEFAALATAVSSETVGCAVKLGAYTLLLRPWLYGLVQSLPGLGLGRTEYETRYTIGRYSGVLAGLALRLARRVDEINAARIRTAASIATALEGARQLRLLTIPQGSRPVYARLPVFVRDPALRDRLVSALQRAGIGASASYPAALVDVPEVARRLPRSSDEIAPDAQAGARAVAASVITLPTHAWCPADIGIRIRRVVDAAGAQ